MNPFCIPFSIHNMGGALLAMDLGFMGPNYPINTACATGNYCLIKCALLTPAHPMRDNYYILFNFFNFFFLAVCIENATSAMQFFATH